ncbi:unnamed protein product [Prorocentrum cordatum]|uniref:Major facilitator superfamily (MFS) profile domain-containing protein n=1 Tax=Prorocentrum cordatum TaxID=2364126 RepID=A0ABN9VYM1_9DINO|nr:unnamed protein product [Polarella glacialis]
MPSCTSARPRLGVAENDFKVGIDVIKLVATFSALHLVDRCGRLTLLVWGASGMALACGAVGLVGRQLALAEDGEAGGFALRAAMASAVLFFAASFAYGWGSVTWVYCAEIFPEAQSVGRPADSAEQVFC